MLSDPLADLYIFVWSKIPLLSLFSPLAEIWTPRHLIVPFFSNLPFFSPAVFAPPQKGPPPRAHKTSPAVASSKASSASPPSQDHSAASTAATPRSTPPPLRRSIGRCAGAVCLRTCNLMDTSVHASPGTPGEKVCSSGPCARSKWRRGRRRHPRLAGAARRCWCAAHAWGVGVRGMAEPLLHPHEHGFLDA